MDVAKMDLMLEVALELIGRVHGELCRQRRLDTAEHLTEAQRQLFLASADLQK